MNCPQTAFSVSHHSIYLDHGQRLQILEEAGPESHADIFWCIILLTSRYAINGVIIPVTQIRSRDSKRHRALARMSQLMVQGWDWNSSPVTRPHTLHFLPHLIHTLLPHPSHGPAQSRHTIKTGDELTASRSLVRLPHVCHTLY